MSTGTQVTNSNKRRRIPVWVAESDPFWRVIRELAEDKSLSLARITRDGVRLILDLYQGNVDVLLELFPFVRNNDQLMEAQNSELVQRMELLKAEVESLRALMTATTRTYEAAPITMADENTRPLLAVDGDDERRESTEVKTRKNSAKAFLDQLGEV